jgi:DNA polymerase
MTKPRKTAKRTASKSSAADFLPERRTITKLRAAAKDCRGCHLYKVGTQTVFGEGPSRASLLVVGEQPGDAEDRAGRPFVGPAGRLLDRALEQSGIDRDDVYVTNAVKHFKWAREARSKRRIHKTPNRAEVRACFPWLENEIALVRPRVILCLGATAAKALLGASFSVMKKRGVPVESEWAEAVVATVHPAAVLRVPPEERSRAERMFVADVRRVAKELSRAKRKPAERSARRFAAWQTTDGRSTTSSASTQSSRE